MNAILKNIFIISILILFNLNPGIAGTKSLDPNTATELIENHFGEYYIDIPIGKIVEIEDKIVTIFESPYVRLLKKVKETGLVDYKTYQKKNSKGIITHTITESWLTEKGKKSKYIDGDLETEYNKYLSASSEFKYVNFFAGNMKVLKVIKIEDETIFFSLIYYPNNVGKTLGFSDEKYRGKAKFKYDIFLEKFLFLGVAASPWEKEEWNSMGWIDIVDGKKVIKRETE